MKERIKERMGRPDVMLQSHVRWCGYKDFISANMDQQDGGLPPDNAVRCS